MTFSSLALAMMQTCVFLLVVVAVAVAAEEPERSYHSTVGIPMAESIQKQENSSNRIAGGRPVQTGAQPHLGGLVITLVDGRTSVCGSSMLSNTKAITAAHCWFDGQLQARRFTVVYGSTRLYRGGKRVTTEDVKVHPEYDVSTLRNDIAIITHKFVEYSQTIKNIRLPSGTQVNDDFVGKIATAAGYGRTGDNAAIGSNQGRSQVSVPVISNAECAAVYGRSLAVTASTLCTSGAGGRSVCPGDSGGPLALGKGDTRILIGVTSFGARAGCERGFPTGFSRVTSFLPWIQQNI